MKINVINSLKNKLNTTREIYKLSTDKKKLFLTEQSKIAKELELRKISLIFPILKENKQKFLTTAGTTQKN